MLRIARIDGWRRKAAIAAIGVGWLTLAAHLLNARYLSLPLGVPGAAIVLLAFLQGRAGLLAVAVWFLMGAVGLPVFSPWISESLEQVTLSTQQGLLVQIGISAISILLLASYRAYWWETFRPLFLLSLGCCLIPVLVGFSSILLTLESHHWWMIFRSSLLSIVTACLAHALVAAVLFRAIFAMRTAVILARN